MMANVCLVTINTGENSPLEDLLAAENLPLAGLEISFKLMEQNNLRLLLSICE